jgi:hypothetical protein
MPYGKRVVRPGRWVNGMNPRGRNHPRSTASR